MKRIPLKKAYFGVATVDINGDIQFWNLFDNLRVKLSVASYVVMTPEAKKLLLMDPCRFCFGDVWSRCEYEFVVNRWPFGEKDLVSGGRKMDVYQMFVEPNKDHLMTIVNSISKSSARKYLAEERKKRRKASK